MAIWSRLIGGIAAIGVGGAAQRAIEPVLEPERQKAWEQNPVRVLALGQIAELVAQGLLDAGKQGYAEASKEGFEPSRVDALVQAMIAVPGVSEALTLVRRNGLVGQDAQISDAQLTHVLTKLKIDPQYHASIKAMVNLPLESAQLAQGIHRGYIKYEAPGFVAPPQTPGKVPFYPQTNIDAAATAAANGEDAEQLQVLVGIAGLPLSLFEMLELLNRDLVTEDDVKRAIANSNLQNQYMDVAINLRRRLLTPSEYSELRLRGWITDQDGRDGAALSGMEPADADLLYHMHGRPLIPHQIQTAIERGGVYDDPMKEDTPGTIRAEIVAELLGEGYSLTNAHAFIDAAQESNIQPQYYRMYIANRFAIPPLFQTVNLLKAGSIPAALATEWLLKGGYDPVDVATIVTDISGGGKATTSTYVKSAQTAVVTAAKKIFTAGGLPPLDAIAYLEAAGISPADAAAIIAQWEIVAQIEGVNIDTAGGTPH